MDTYKTISAPAEGLYKEKGSKFISYAYPVNSEEEIEVIVKTIKKEHFSARHHCYSWRIGYKGEMFRMVDDGEPSSTAGKPIFGQILSYELTNILIIVVRYFGGTKLGVSGLIQAYKEAARDVLNNSQIVEKSIESIVKIRFGYIQLNDVMKVIKDMKPTIVSQNYDNISEMELSIRLSQYEMLLNRLEDIEGLNILI